MLGGPSAGSTGNCRFDALLPVKAICYGGRLL